MADEPMMDDGVILAEESGEDRRVAEGVGAQGPWVAWIGGDKKVVRLIALDDEAFYAKAASLDQTVTLIEHLRAGAPPSVVLAKGRVIRLDKMTAIQAEEKSTRLTIIFLALAGAANWNHKGFPAPVLRDFLDELARRMPDAKRWHRAYTPWRAALYPLVSMLVVGLWTFGAWAMAQGWLDDSSPSPRPSHRAVDSLLKALGPTAVAAIGCVILLGQAVWLVRSFRNPPIRAGIKPKATLWNRKKNIRMRESTE